MKPARLYSSVPLICVLATCAGITLSADALAQTPPRGSSNPARLTLAQNSSSASPAATSRGKITHRVRRGETLSTIAKRYGTSVTAIKRWNGLRGSTIRAGRRLTIYTTRRAAPAQEITPKFKLVDGALVPDLRAEAAIIYNPETGQVLWEQNSHDQRSIASITKVMTAAVFLEDSPDLSRKVVVHRADVRSASVTYLRAGYKVSLDDLMHLLLIASDNGAARVLARVSPYGSDGFIDRMNEKALELGLTSTHYADPSGLLAANVSSAYDMARLIAYVAGDERISAIMRKQRHSVPVGRRTITVRSTNHLVRQGDVDVLGGKTGFIRKAGFCLATLLRLPQDGAQIAVVVLGAKSSAGRFAETRQLFNWFSSKARELLGGTRLEAAVVEQ